jgi:2-haloacid dehalogenase
MTAFWPRPTEYGPHQTRDFVAEQDWDVVAKDIEDLAAQLGV